LAGLCAPLPAAARWKPEYAQLPKEVVDWYQTRKLTKATQKRLRVSWDSCCSNADVVKTRFRVSRVDNDDIWEYELPDGTWKEVPADIIHWGDHSPSGDAVLFAVSSHGPVCFFPPRSGQ